MKRFNAKRLVQLLKKRNAQAMVEFAMILPVLIVILGMTFSLGEELFVKMSLQMAAYEGARAGIVDSYYAPANGTPNAQTDADTAAKKLLQGLPFIDSTQESTTYSLPSGTWTKGDPFVVYTNYTITTLFPIPGITGWGVGDTHAVQGKVELAIEG